MVVQEEIARLKRHGHSQRSAAAILGLDRATVARYWDGACTDAQPPPPPDWAQQLDWAYIDNEINVRHISRKIIYQELAMAHALPAYSNFCRYVAKRCAESRDKHITVRIKRIPGHSVEVDYAGQKWQIINPATGEIITVHLFVAAMSYSGDFYAEFTYSENQSDFMSSHVRMFRYFGGVPNIIIPDNCKTAVTKADDYDPVLSEAYHDMCKYYDIICDPARKYHPKDKPNVEAAVQVLQDDFLQRIRNRTFTSLQELNAELLNYLRSKRQEVVKDRGQSRAYYFELERPALRALPTTDYQLAHFKQAKVHPDCHVQHDRNFYSVPYQHVGKTITLKHTQTMLYAYVDGKCVATHALMKGHGHYATIEEHYPEKKIVDLHMSILSAKTAAARVGPNTHILVCRLFDTVRHPLKNLRKVQGILTLSRNYKTEAMEWATETALQSNKLFYAFIKQCAESYRPPKDQTYYKAPQRQLELICLQGGIE